MCEYPSIINPAVHCYMREMTESDTPAADPEIRECLLVEVRY